MQVSAQQVKDLAVRFIEKGVVSKQLVVLNRSINLCHERRLCFVHNPKAMGTSMKGWLGLRTDDADHQFPTLMVNKDTWEDYTTVLVVRNPIDRFLSSFNHHCRSDYQGGYLTRHPDMKSLEMESYFRRMTQQEPQVLAPQSKYAVHLLSDQPIDYIIKMGPPSPDLMRLAARLGIVDPLPQLNRSSIAKPAIRECFIRELEDYYRGDFEMFDFAHW
jgi:hypothetical protein